MKILKLFRWLHSRRECYVVDSKISREIQPPNSGTDLQKESEEPWIKCRYIAVLLGFAVEFFYLAHRINISVGIVAMVNNSALMSTSLVTTSKSCLNLIENASQLESGYSRNHEIKDGEFLWEPKLQGYILGSSLLSFAVAASPMGMLTEIIGCKKMLFWGTFLSSLFTVLTPFAAWWDFYVIIIVQGLRGLTQAGFVSALTVLLVNWCPKSERGFSITFMLTGTCWGAMIGSYVSGILCESSILGGWPSSFYVTGGAGIITSLFIGCFMHENPTVHPTISKEELRYIISNQENVLTDKMLKTPWGKLFTSVPVYALSCAYFGQIWAISLFQVYPIYLGTILHYSMEENGLFSALPFFLQLFTSLSGSSLSTCFDKKKYMSVNTARKFWNFLSCFGFSVCLLGICVAGCNRSLSVVFSVLSFSFTGFGYAGCWITPPDMSPQFAGPINVIACLFGLNSSFILPLLVGFLTNKMQTIEQWNKVLFISIGVVMSSGIIFAIFGSAKVQPWNDCARESSSDIKTEKDLCQVKTITL